MKFGDTGAQRRQAGGIRLREQHRIELGPVIPDDARREPRDLRDAPQRIDGGRQRGEDRLAQDEQSWESLGPELAGIEAVASDLAGRAVWSRTPSTVALVSSLAELCHTAPGLRGLSVGRLLATELSPRADSICSAVGPRREALQPQTRNREALALR